MAKLDVNNIISYIDCKGDNEVERTAYLYRKIGEYFINNADRMASDATINTHLIKFKIDISFNEIITIDKTIKEYLMEGEINE